MSTSSSTATADSTSASVVDATTAGAPTQIALKIRTLDQKTYSITIGSDASVPQLKEVVKSETGVDLPRQRLIFRGKVLKNDQNIAAYALEDGHVVHLVVRAEPPPQSDTPTDAPQIERGNNGSTTTTQRGGRTTTATRVQIPIEPRGGPRNNDEPDPTIGASPRNRFVMGATISVPEGTDVSMPFLSSMIANLVNSMGNGGGTANNAGGGDGIEVLSMEELFQRQRTRSESLRRLRRRTRGERSGSTGSPGSTAAQRLPRASSTTTGSASGGDLLREHADNQLRRVTASLSNQGFDFESLTQEDLDASNDGDAALVQAQLRQWQELVERYAARANLLPSALREIRTRGQNGQEVPNGLFSSTVSAIDTLQHLGDSASSIARFARHVVLENSPDLPMPMPQMFRLDDRGGGLRASLSIPMSNVTDSRSDVQFTVPQRPLTRSDTTQTATAATGHRAATSNNNNDGNGGLLQSLYQRVTSGLLGSANRGAPSTSTEQTNESTTASATSAGGPSRFTFTTVSGPFPPVFPFSSATTATTSPPGSAAPTWNIDRFWERLARHTPASLVFGVLRGDPQSIHEAMIYVGSILSRGLYMPPVPRSSVRSWTRLFMSAIRRELIARGIPSSVLEFTPDRDVTRFAEEVTRTLGPLMPELTDHVMRASSASRGDVFVQSCAPFFRNMAQHFVGEMRRYTAGDDAHVRRLFEAALVWMGLDSDMSAVVVGRFMTWIGASGSSNDRPRRERDESGDTTTEASASGPAAKRRRG